MDILDKYYVFCTLDEGLIEPSYVFFRTLFKHNPYIKLHVHCINFSEDKLKQYTDNINTYWKDNIEIIPEQIHIGVDLSEKLANCDGCMKHPDALISKIIITDRHYKPYMFHLDLDMLVRDDFSELFQEYEEELVGHRYKETPDINAGVMIIHTTRNISTDLMDYLLAYWKGINEVKMLDEEYIRSQNLVTKFIDYRYCVGCLLRTGFTTRNAKIVHFYGDFKPYYKWEVLHAYSLLLLPYAKEWLDAYDTLDPSLFPTISPIVEQHRNTINKLAPIYLKMYKNY